MCVCGDIDSSLFLLPLLLLFIRDACILHVQFLNPLLSHPNGTVREPAIKLVLDLYKQVSPLLTHLHVEITILP